MEQTILPILKILVLVSILFVWVIRYENITQEFKHYGYPTWLRDLVGILKITCAVMLLNADVRLNQLGAMGIALLMFAALLTHLKVKNPPQKMVPAFCLLSACLAILSLIS